MSKLVKNNAAFFLIAVLVAGIITISSSPSFIDTEASGEKRDHNKYKNFRSDNFNSKDPTVIVKKITCNNVNVIIDGLNMDISPDDIASGLVTAQAQANDNNDNNEDISANSLVNDGERNDLSKNQNNGD
ncbi:MAG: hypothetical protein MUO21_05425, partial [Nitrososphaeraceae archaeon]|nr:hypothetical protein [Nitrososphaeraceae archaeon]